MENHITSYLNYLGILGLAPRTKTIYKSILIKFLKQHPNLLAVTQNDIIAFMLQRGAARTIKQTHGALNHFYIGVLNSKAIQKIPQPKVSDFVPNILSEIEIIHVIGTIKNIKHEAIIQLIYSCALRISEVLNLKIEDVSKTKNQIKIVEAKGGRTDYVPIPEPTKNLLRQYYIKERPSTYLFEGSPGVKYSRSSVRKVLNKALTLARINKRIRVHDLRHSRATHLLEHGMDIKILKDILRHAKIETTERYLHLTTKSLESAMLAADTKIKLNIMHTPQELQAA